MTKTSWYSSIKTWLCRLGASPLQHAIDTNTSRSGVPRDSERLSTLDGQGINGIVVTFEREGEQISSVHFSDSLVGYATPYDSSNYDTTASWRRFGRGGIGSISLKLGIVNGSAIVFDLEIR